MRHFKVFGDAGRILGEIWANDETTARALADAIYAMNAHFLRAVSSWEEAHAY